jgi:hypothetical protein
VALTLSGGAVSDSAPTTDSLGYVKEKWTLPETDHAGSFHLQARVDGIVQPADVVATVLAKPQKASTLAHHRRT